MKPATETVSASPSGNFEDRIDDDRQIATHRRRAEHGASMHTARTEDLDHQIRATIEDLGVLIKIRGSVDESLQLHDAGDAIEIAQRLYDYGQDVEARPPGELVALGRRKVAPQLAFWRGPIQARGPFARYEQQVAADDEVSVVGGGAASRRQPQPQLAETFRGGHGAQHRNPGHSKSISPPPGSAS